MLVTSIGLIEELKDKSILVNICTFLNKRVLMKHRIFLIMLIKTIKEKNLKIFLVHIKQKGMILN